MKTVVLSLLIILSSAAISDAKKFTVTFTVTYNAISLEDAAKKEIAFREHYKDACIVDVTVKEVYAGGVLHFESPIRWDTTLPYIQNLQFDSLDSHIIWRKE